MKASRISKFGFGACLFLSNVAFGGLIGGGPSIENITPPYVPIGYQYSPATGPIYLTLISIIDPQTLFFSVAENTNGNGLLGGLSGPNSVAFHYNLDGWVTNLNLSSYVPVSFINSVAINSSDNGFIGGADFSGADGAPLTLLYSSGSLTNLGLAALVPKGEIVSVSINSLGEGLFGGVDDDLADSAPLVFSYTPGGGAVNLNLKGAIAEGSIVSTSINSLGEGLIGGSDSTGANPAPLAYRYTSGGGAVNLNLKLGVAEGFIQSVSINSLGNGLIGGGDTTGGMGSAPLAYYYASGGAVTNLNLSGLVPLGSISSVSFNSSGEGLLGGRGGTTNADIPLAFYYTLGGGPVNLNLSSIVPKGLIYSVAMHDSGIGLIGGVDLTDPTGGAPLALLYSPGGLITNLNLSSLPYGGVQYGVVYSVALNSLLGIIFPTTGITGNNLVLIDYIKEFNFNKIFYLFPSQSDGTLNEALESIAPTRNAFPVFTAANNVFALNSAFSGHSNSTRAFRRMQSSSASQETAHNRHRRYRLSESELVAYGSKVDPDYDFDMDYDFKVYPYSDSHPQVDDGDDEEECEAWYLEPFKDERPYQIWGTILGGPTYQKSQNQAPAFSPRSVGGIVGFDAHVTAQGWVGAGAAYTYSYIHQDQNAGHSSINQESFFLSALWDTREVYFSSVIWAGLFQTRTLRNIQMTGFDFTSKSKPKGWQLAPSIELGYDANFNDNMFTFEPFCLVNWANNWQGDFQETGTNPFNMGQSSHYSSLLYSELGFRLYESVNLTNLYISFMEKVSYINQNPFKVGQVNAFIVGSPGSFTLNTFTEAQNLGAVEFKVIFSSKSAKNPSGTIDYQGTFGTQYQSHVFSANLFWEF